MLLDLVESLTSARAAVGVRQGGYRVELAVPRADVGLTGPTRTFGLDVDINFSDPAGQRNVACLRWGRNGASLVYDLPTEARFEPENWGTAAFAP